MIKQAFIHIIKFYQRFLSPLKGSTCVFYPTCSEYTKQAIQKYGVFKGFLLGFYRILRCHPWQKNHIDLLR
ncbi:membrane protein insertion efficiency factor YidD [Candidatus Nomurabacteria bacterium]|nr:membrane protein insertion efficiency factor YidD [Candidatus Nomurabacteria bacterium]